MTTYQCSIEGVTPYASSKFRTAEYLDKESHDAYEKRTWRQKLTTDDKAIVQIPAMAFKFGLTSACKYLGEKKGKGTFTKYFESGVLVPENASLGVHAKEAEPVTVLVNSDGKRGSGSRVMRIFPTFRQWGCTVTIIVLDETITLDLLKRTLEAMGQYIGVGQFRAERGGLNGRFKIIELKRV